MEGMETRMREALQRNIGTQPARPMPGGTRGRIRGRQVRWVTGVAVTGLAAAVAGLGLVRILPRHAPPAYGPASGSMNPLERVPEGWPTVVIGDPADGYRMPQEVANSSGPVRVIASGTVNGYGFSFQSFVGAGSTDESGPCLGFAGPGLDHFASPAPQPPDAVGGISSGTCAGAQGVPANKDMYLAGQIDTQTPGIAPNYGFLSSRVDHLVLRLDDGSTVQIPVLESPPGWDGVQAFLFFPPNGTDGTLIAYSKDGMELASAQICKYSQVSGGCGGVVKQLAPISCT